uniref:histone deacetylase n=2 Tax=Lygus hesperus TaxID=30085 RepID=A0A0K8TDF1_LYGHE
MTRESPVASPALARRNDINGHEAAFHEQFLQVNSSIKMELPKSNASGRTLITLSRQRDLLKKRQEIQQQILLQHFQAEQQRLAKEHEAQMRAHLQEMWEKKKAAEEQEREREAREKERLESLKKKGKHEESAVASEEVKQRLQGFLLEKKQREAAAAAANGGAASSQPYRNWTVLQQNPSAEGVPPGPPYRLNPLLKYEDEYPLRKTVESGSSNPDSGPNSPPVHASSQLSPPAGHTTPIQEEGEMQYGSTSVRSEQGGSLSDLSALYTSPSLPNISLGRPPNTSSNESKLAPVSEAEVRAAYAARLGLPLTGQMLPGTLPFYPTLPSIDGEYSNPTSPSYIQKQMASLEQTRPPIMASSVYHPPPPITDTQVAHARLNKNHRPLGRTQSAPLPLGHPMLNTQAPPISNIVHYEDTRDYQPPPTHQPSISTNLLKQQIRQTVLTRVEREGRVHMISQLENTPEADDTPEVIDLTEKSSRHSEGNEEESELSRQQRDRETFLQQQRDLMMRHSLQVNQGCPTTASRTYIGRPLARALSSPLVGFGPEAQVGSNHTSPKIGWYLSG